MVGFSQVVLLDGSESSDEEGEISGFLWEQLGGEAVSLFSADQEIATFYTPTISGALSFVLTVFDNHGLSDQDTIDVYISSLSIVSKKNNAVISGVALFPNPFNSALIINFNNTKTKKISIYDINGKTIESRLINNRQNINKQISKIWRSWPKLQQDLWSKDRFEGFPAGDLAVD